MGQIRLDDTNILTASATWHYESHVGSLTSQACCHLVVGLFLVGLLCHYFPDWPFGAARQRPRSEVSIIEQSPMRLPLGRNFPLRQTREPK